MDKAPVLKAVVIAGLLDGLPPGHQLPVLEQAHPHLGNLRNVTALSIVVGIPHPVPEDIGGDVQVPVFQGDLVKAPGVIQIHHGDRLRIQFVEVLEELGLPEVLREEHHRHLDVVHQGAVKGGGEGLPLRQFRRDLQRLPAAHRQEGGGHPLPIGFRHRPGADGHGSGGDVRLHPVHCVVGGQVVLGLEDLLHPAADTVDLAVHRVGDPVQGVLEVVVLVLHLVHLAGKPEQAHGQAHCSGHNAYFDNPTAAGGQGLGLRLGGDVPGDNLLHHLQLFLAQFPAAGRFRRVLRRRGILHAQEPAHADGKQFAHGDELLDLRQGVVALPLADGLPGDPQGLPQRLLGEIVLLPLLGDPLSNRHALPLPFSPSIAKPLPKRPPTGGFFLSTTGCSPSAATVFRPNFFSISIKQRARPWQALCFWKQLFRTLPPVQNPSARGWSAHRAG